MIETNEMPFARAIHLAQLAHDGQVRKYTGEPYIMHPLAVSVLVEWFGGDDEQRIAAILHDVVEDSAFTIDTIQQMFSPRVTAIVEQMTDMHTPEQFPNANRGERKAMERLRWRTPIKGAPLVKVCDLLHNAQSIRRHDPGFWKVFRKEALWLIEDMMPHLPDEIADHVMRSFSP